MRRAALILSPWILIVAIWYGVAYSGFVNPALIPTPHAVAAQFWEQLVHARLPRDILMSTQRVLIGVTTGIIAAVPVGFVLGWYPRVRTFIDPLINFFRALPLIALIPLVVVYFGIGEVAKVVILFYASFFAGVIVMYEGIAQISPIYIRVARTLGASDAEIFAKVIIPLTVPLCMWSGRSTCRALWSRRCLTDLRGMRKGAAMRTFPI